MLEGDRNLDIAPKKSWKWGCVGLIALCATLAYGLWFFWGYVPLSTLPVREEAETKLEQVCVKPPPDRKLPGYEDETYYHLLQIWPPVT